jgi:hypothetical protein
MQKWSELINKNTSTIEMINRSQFQEYIKEAVSMKEKLLFVQ